MSKGSLIIFAKNPELGKVKTRLANAIGEEKALAVYQQLLSHTHLIAREVRVDKFLFYSSYVDQDDLWDNEEFYKELQHGSNLGERMKNAFDFAFKDQAEKVVLIGTDCPSMSREIIENAFEELNSHDVVLGPAADGGYYLIGMNKLHNDLFNDISWSTSEVLSKTVFLCKRFELSHFLLPLLYDVDEEKDLKEWISKMRNEALTDIADVTD